MQQIYRRTDMLKCDFSKVAKQLYWNRPLALMFSYKPVVYFQNTFFWEHLWVAASSFLKFSQQNLSVLYNGFKTHDGEQLGFYKKVHIRAGCSCNNYIARNEEFQFIWKNCTQGNVLHSKHEKSWLKWIVIEQVNYYFPLIFSERYCARTLSKPLWKK